MPRLGIPPFSVSSVLTKSFVFNPGFFSSVPSLCSLCSLCETIFFVVKHANLKVGVPRRSQRGRPTGSQLHVVKKCLHRDDHTYEKPGDRFWSCFLSTPHNLTHIHPRHPKRASSRDGEDELREREVRRISREGTAEETIQSERYR